MCGLKFWTRGRCDSRPPPAPKRTKSLGRAASSLRRPRHALLKRDLVPEVIRARLLGRGRLVLLRLDAEREELAAVLRSADPTREPVFVAGDVQRAAVVALLVVARVFFVVPEQSASVRIVVVHFRVSSAQDYRCRRCAEAPGRFVDESFDGGRMRVHLAALSMFGLRRVLVLCRAPTLSSRSRPRSSVATFAFPREWSCLSRPQQLLRGCCLRGIARSFGR